MRARLGALVAWLVGGVLFGPPLLRHFSHGALDPYFFADDARNQVMPYLRWVEPAAFANDFVGDYGFDTIPIGVKFLFWLGSFLFDPTRLSEWLPYPLLALVVYGVGRCSERLAPPRLRGVAFFASAALVLGAEIYLERMAGTLPRAFGYPTFALGLLYTVEGRLRRAAGVALLAAVLYPTGAVLIAGGLFSVLVFLPAASRGEARCWTAPQRGRRFALFALAVGLASTPTWLATLPHGPRVTLENLEQYPEGGPEGTHGPDDRPPYPGFFSSLDDYALRGVFGHDPWWPGPSAEGGEGLVFDVFAVLSAVGIAGWGRRARTRRFAAVAVGAGFAHIAARLMAPHLYAPSRFAMYAVPPLAAVGLPVGLLWLGQGLGATRRTRDGLAVLAVGLLVALVGGRGSSEAGLTVWIDDEQLALYEHVAQLEPDVLIAGWPDEAMSNLPYVARRRAYMTGEMHMGYHAGFLEKVRTRLRPFFKAYLSEELAPLQRLRRERGVTHILVEKAHFVSRDMTYMPPYRTEILALWDALGDRVPALLSFPDAVGFESERYLLVDLGRLE